MDYRIEHDSMGEMKVPADRYWAAQTQRSSENFKIGVDIEIMPREITRAFGVLKKAAAQANAQLRPEKMTGEKLVAIEKACDEKVISKMNNEDKLDYLESLVFCSVHKRKIFITFKESLEVCICYIDTMASPPMPEKSRFYVVKPKRSFQKKIIAKE